MEDILGSIVVSIPACHAGDRGSIPRRGGCNFPSMYQVSQTRELQKRSLDGHFRQALGEMYARLAQSVEHQTFNLRVAGSSPSSGASLYDKLQIRKIKYL